MISTTTYPVYSSDRDALIVYNERICRCRVKVKRWKDKAVVSSVWSGGVAPRSRYVFPADPTFYPVGRQPKCGCLPGSMFGNYACPHSLQVTC